MIVSNNNNNAILVIINLFVASKMIRAMQIINANTLTSIIGFSESFIPNSVYTQCIRWKRKPIWLPTAKSKLFRVPKKRVVPVDENEETKRLYNHYRTYMSSLRYIHKTCTNMALIIFPFLHLLD
jgi:hypothetical protein